jgi:hypothetical protein
VGKSADPTLKNGGWGTRKGKLQIPRTLLTREAPDGFFNAAKLLMGFLAARELLIAMTLGRETFAARGRRNALQEGRDSDKL